jgi:tetratricopeptide (TPR) repeat protein
LRNNIRPCSADGFAGRRTFTAGNALDSQRDLITRGLQLQQQGHRAEAEVLFRQALAAVSPNPLAFYCYGRLALELGQCEVAVEHLAHAAAADSKQAIYHADLAQAYQALGRLDEAIDSYRRALDLDPQRAEVHVNVGNALLQCGRAAEAVGSYQRAIELAPDMADAYNALGTAFEQQDRQAQALEAFRRATQLRPDYGLAHFNLGTVLIRRGLATDALVALERAVELMPAFAAARHNLGVACNLLHRPADAQVHFEQALATDSSSALYHFNLGDVLEQQGQLDRALLEYEAALGWDPGYQQARMSRGTLLLKLGRYSEGFRDYEARVGLPQYDTLVLSEPTWDGNRLAEDCVLLVHCEQGLGDTLQFIRYVRLAQQRAANVVIAARPELIPLLRSSGYGDVVSIRDPLPSFDVQAALMSLPRITGTELDSVPAAVPYLAADTRLVEAWRSRLADFPGFRVGIHWQGNPIYTFDYLRSVPLGAFEPLANVPAVRLFALQKKDGRDQLAGVQSLFAVLDLGDELDNESGLFMDTAAVIENLDLVVTSDTSVAHLAGGLGARTWLALAQSAEWRWLVGRDDSPWYPTMRLFRQRTLGDWSDVFQRMAESLGELVAGNAGKR